MWSGFRKWTDTFVGLAAQDQVGYTGGLSLLEDLPRPLGAAESPSA